VRANHGYNRLGINNRNFIDDQTVGMTRATSCLLVALAPLLIFPLRIDLKGVLVAVFGGMLESHALQ
jgi:hypothetical protein